MSVKGQITRPAESTLFPSGLRVRASLHRDSSIGAVLVCYKAGRPAFQLFVFMVQEVLCHAYMACHGQYQMSGHVVGERSFVA